MYEIDLDKVARIFWLTFSVPALLFVYFVVAEFVRRAGAKRRLEARRDLDVDNW